MNEDTCMKCRYFELDSKSNECGKCYANPLSTIDDNGFDLENKIPKRKACDKACRFFSFEK